MIEFDSISKESHPHGWILPETSTAQLSLAEKRATYNDGSSGEMTTSQVMLGASMSLTLTSKSQETRFPASSVAVNSLRVSPLSPKVLLEEKRDPDSNPYSSRNRYKCKLSWDDKQTKRQQFGRRKHHYTIRTLVWVMETVPQLSLTVGEL